MNHKDFKIHTLVELIEMKIDKNYRYNQIRLLLNCGIPLAANDLRQGLQMLTKKIGKDKIIHNV